MSFYQKIFSLLIVGLFSLGIACGGSSSSSSNDTEGGAGASGGSGSALTVAEKVSVVDAQESTSSSLSALSKALASDLPNDSDYNTIETFTFVEERSNDSLDLVNEIFCMIGQSGYTDMVNSGDYIAQIDVGQCESNNDSVEGQGESTQDGSSGSGQPEYEFWTLNSFRADENSHHIVVAWIHMPAEEEFDEPAQTIEARVTIFEEPSAANPYGIVEMYFVAHPEDDPTQETFKGYLISEELSDGTVALKFYDHGEFEMDGEVMEFGERVSIIRDGDTILGTAEMEDFGEFGGEFFTYQFSANSNLFYRKSGGNEGDVAKCFNRANFEEAVHRYNLYYDENALTPGALVERESGFSVVFIDGDGERHHGWVGFWGAWFGNSDVAPEHGDTVYRQEFNSDGPPTETPYTLYKSQGKIKKHTLQTITLGEIAGISLSQHDCSESECTQYRVEWNETDQKFYRTGTMNEENWIWEEITPVAVTFDLEDWTFNAWSESLGGDIMVELRNNSTGTLATLSNNSEVIFHREDVLRPTDTLPTTLICFENCPDPSKVDTSSPHFTKSSWESGEETYSDLAQNVPTNQLVNGTHYVTYTVDPDNMVIEYNGTPVVSSGNSESEFGLWTGPLMESTQANLNQLACDWSPTTSTCPWEAFSTLPVYYTYETGDNEWNVLTLLQDPDTGDFLAFDPPLMLEYTHTNDNKYYVDYNGPGDLGRIPGKCVDMDTGVETECGNWEEDKPIRWVPEFNIADGSVVTDAATDTNYYVKGIEKEQRMIPGSNEECADLEFSDSDLPELPDESLWQAPDIGDEPALEDAAPAFIGGVPQN